MSTLRKVDSNSLWGQSAQKINDNFDFLSTDVEKICNATTRNKGYYAITGETEQAVIEQINGLGLSPVVGDKIYIGTRYPYAEFQYTDAGWVKTSEEAGAEHVNLGDYYTKQEAEAVFLGWQDEPETIKTVEETLVETAVRKTPQILTEEEKAVVRNNIASLGIPELGKLNILVWE